MAESPQLDPYIRILLLDFLLARRLVRLFSGEKRHSKLKKAAN
jgi:hypothetical protein